LVTVREQNPALVAYVPAIKIFTKHLLAFGKLFRRLQQLSHQRFASHPACGDLVLFYWSEIVAATNGPAQSFAGKYITLFYIRYSSHYIVQQTTMRFYIHPDP